MATSDRANLEASRSEDLVQVFGSDDESEVLVVKGLLESTGIECIRRNFDAPQDVLPGVGGVAILVRAHQADEARRIIEENRNTSATELEAAATEAPGPDDQTTD